MIGLFQIIRINLVTVQGRVWIFPVRFAELDKMLSHFPSQLVDSRMTIGLPRQWMQSTQYYDRVSLTSSF